MFIHAKISLMPSTEMEKWKVENPKTERMYRER